MIDLRQTPEYAKFLELEGWTVVRKNEVNYFLKKLPLVGYLLKIQRPEKINFETIDQLCRMYHIFQIAVEPKHMSQVPLLITNRYKLSKSPFLPTKTLQIDLTQSKEEIYKDFQRNIKTGLRRAYSPERVVSDEQSRTIEPRVEGEWSPQVKQYSSGKEIVKFREEWKKSVKLNRYVPSVDTLLNLTKSFPQNKLLFLASHNNAGRIIGGVIFTITSHGLSNYITSYLYGFTSKVGRSSLAHASLLYQGILWGKRMDCKIFDFEGIYDDRFPNKSWLGFTRFKKSFGGYEVLYPGCYTKYRFPFYAKQ